LKEILDETYGVILYQEQVIAKSPISWRVFHRESGHPRRAMGKEEERGRWLRSARSHGRMRCPTKSRRKKP